MRARFWIVVVLAFSAVACGEKVDLTKGLEVVDVSTGWWDAGIVDGQNKLVPSISFKFKNISDQTLSTLQANVLFRRVDEDAEWSSSFVRIVGSDGLPPGGVSQQQTVNAQKGYTGLEPRRQMLENSQFVDARVLIFAKYGSTQWQPVGEFPVTRRLIAK